MNDDDGAQRSAGDPAGKLQAECEEIRAPLAMHESLQYLGGNPVLDVPDEMLAGYLILESDERGFTAEALHQHRDFVMLWYRYFNLLREAIVGTGEPRDIPELSVHDQLSMRFIAVASGTAKLILDAGLAGYYAQAYGMVRHLFETWLRLEYIRMRPTEANKWFVSEDGKDRIPPNGGTIQNYVVSRAKGARKKNVILVLKKISDFNKMAHPSEAGFQQTVAVTGNAYKFGANYVPELCVGVLHDGASGLRFILQALDDALPQTEEWRKGLRDVADEHEKVLDQAMKRLRREDGDT